MPINIAAPGEDEAALKAAFANLTGWAKISSGVISEPIEYYDVALPSGYDQFILEISDQVVDLNGNDNLVCYVSTDGGTTFLNDLDNFDSYCLQRLVGDSDLGGRVGWESGEVTYFAAMRLTFANGQPAVPNTASVKISPGSSDASFIVLSQWSQPVGGYPFYKSSDNLSSTVPFTRARITTLRIAPEGNFDANPPTSEETIDSGSWALYGHPTPT